VRAVTVKAATTETKKIAATKVNLLRITSKYSLNLTNVPKYG